MIDLDDIETAIYSAASGSENRVLSQDKTPSDDAVTKLRRRIIRFLDEIDADMTVEELRDHLKTLEEPHGPQ